jgi:cytidylate kinase
VEVMSIDGYAVTWKGSVCKELLRREEFRGWHYLDSGLLYRAVGMLRVINNLCLHDHQGIISIAESLDLTNEDGRVFLQGKDVTKDIRSQASSDLAKMIAPIQGVRGALLLPQLRMRKAPGLIADGRDTAHIFQTGYGYSYFLNASSVVRAKRKLGELERLARVNPSEIKVPTLEEVRRGIIKRDHDDEMNRASPLMPGPCALVLDTSHERYSSPADVSEVIVHYYRQRKEADAKRSAGK